MRSAGRLAEEGKLVVAGPFGKNEKSYRGLYIFNVPTIDEAEKLVTLDPAVQAGVFVPDLTLWYGSVVDANHHLEEWTYIYPGGKRMSGAFRPATHKAASGPFGQ